MPAKAGTIAPGAEAARSHPVQVGGCRVSGAANQASRQFAHDLGAAIPEVVLGNPQDMPPCGLEPIGDGLVPLHVEQRRVVDRRVDLDDQPPFSADEVHPPDPVVVAHVDLTPQHRNPRPAVEHLESLLEPTSGGLSEVAAGVDQRPHQGDAGPAAPGHLGERPIHERRCDQSPRPHRVVSPLDPSGLHGPCEVEERSRRSDDRNAAPHGDVVGEQQRRAMKDRETRR